MLNVYFYYNHKLNTLRVVSEKMEETEDIDLVLQLENTEESKFRNTDEIHFIIRVSILFFNLGQFAQDDAKLEIEDNVGMMYLSDDPVFPFKEKYDNLPKEDKDKLDYLRSQSMVIFSKN